MSPSTTLSCAALLALCLPSVAGLRALVLHGKGGTGASTAALVRPLLPAGAEIVSPDGPHAAGRRGFSWWTLPLGQRSYEATEWEGVAESIALCDGLGEFDVVVGHSQGAMLAAILLARGRLGHGPYCGAGVLSGAAWPLPFADLIEAFPAGAGPAPRTLHSLSEVDTVNPPAQALQLAEAMGGQVLRHTLGHVIPGKDPQAAAALSSFLASAE